jgi:hypothetical protein
MARMRPDGGRAKSPGPAVPLQCAFPRPPLLVPPLRSIQSRRKVDMIAAVAVIGPETRRRASRRILVFRYLLRGVNRDALSRRRHRRYWIPRHARFPRRGHRRLPVEICLRCPLAYVPPGSARRTKMTAFGARPPPPDAPQRSADRSDSRRSGLAAGTGLHARGCGKTRYVT